MTVSRFRVARTETRDLADRDRDPVGLRFTPTSWRMSNGVFFGVFVAIAALLTVLALVLH